MTSADRDNDSDSVNIHSWLVGRLDDDDLRKAYLVDVALSSITATNDYSFFFFNFYLYVKYV